MKTFKSTSNVDVCKILGMALMFDVRCCGVRCFAMIFKSIKWRLQIWYGLILAVC